MSKIKFIAEILEVSERTIFRWRKDNKLIIQLMYKYFSDEDLAQFINSQKIDKFELIDEFYDIKQNFISEYERKFIFSIVNYKMKFIDMLLEKSKIAIGIYDSNDLQYREFYFSIKDDFNYKLFLDYLYETKFNYFYRNISTITNRYKDPVIEKFFKELHLRLNYE